MDAAIKNRSAESAKFAETMLEMVEDEGVGTTLDVLERWRDSFESFAEIAKGDALRSSLDCLAHVNYAITIVLDANPWFWKNDCQNS